MLVTMFHLSCTFLYLIFEVWATVYNIYTLLTFLISYKIETWELESSTVRWALSHRITQCGHVECVVESFRSFELDWEWKIKHLSYGFFPRQIKLFKLFNFTAHDISSILIFTLFSFLSNGWQHNPGDRYHQCYHRGHGGPSCFPSPWEQSASLQICLFALEDESS